MRRCGEAAMLIPSIDLLGGRVVQLVQGEKLRLAFDDFEYWIEKFAQFPLVQLIDLDAAMRQGDNAVLVAHIARRLPCQVGGGIRSAERAREMLDAGAKRVIIGSALFTENGAVDTNFAAALAEDIGSDRLVAGIDTKNGRIAVKGWKEQVQLTPDEAIPQLEPFVAAYLYTHVDGEGLMQGFPIEVAARLRALTNRQLIVAGGIRSEEEVSALDKAGADAVVGMAVYTNLLKI
ncbi:MAG TPA: HisA/HisF-related TIM barrel protein [Terracidiphilus sp.]|nr:HisA/HisF-related TIM barrel protein [Terracidiphilus sp.]